MITYIKGRLIEKSPTKIVVEVNGIGYDINISLNTFEKIGDEEKGSEHLLELEKDGGWSALDESWTEIIKNSLNEISL